METKTTQKHTPGEWALKGRAHLVGKPGNRSEEWCGTIEPSGPYRGDVCRIQSCNNISGISSDEARANGYLLAAAPEMLAILKESAKQHSSRGDDGHANAIRRIIAKAEGRDA